MPVRFIPLHVDVKDVSEFRRKHKKQFNVELVFRTDAYYAGRLLEATERGGVQVFLFTHTEIETEQDALRPDALDEDLRYADVTPRILHALRNAGISTHKDLLRRSWKDIKTIRNIGDSSIRSLRKFCENRGYRLLGEGGIDGSH